MTSPFNKQLLSCGAGFCGAQDSYWADPDKTPSLQVRVSDRHF